jgi:adenylyltransferase/sulfurtransferase
MVANCSEVGVLGSVVGVIGAIQATEVIKELTGIGDSLAGRILLCDVREPRFETVRVAWDPDNPLTGRAPTIVDLSVHQVRTPAAAGAATDACSHGNRAPPHDRVG